MLEKGEVGATGGTVDAVAAGTTENVGDCNVDKAAAAANGSMVRLDPALRGSVGSDSRGDGSADTTTEGAGPLAAAGAAMAGSGDVGKTFGSDDAGRFPVVGVVGDDGERGGTDIDTERGYDKTPGTSAEDMDEMLPVEAERPLAGMDAVESAWEGGRGDASGTGSVADTLGAVGTGRVALMDKSLATGGLIESGAASSAPVGTGVDG